MTLLLEANCRDKCGKFSLQSSVFIQYCIFFHFRFQVLSNDPIQQISQESLPRVVAAKLPIFIRKDDSYVRLNNLPRTPKFFKDSSRGQSTSVPASKVSRIVNDNGRIHLVNVDQSKPNIGGTDEKGILGKSKYETKLNWVI